MIKEVEKVSKTRGIPLIETLVLSSERFQEAEERNKMSFPTICYVLSNGDCVNKLTQEERKTLKEFALSTQFLYRTAVKATFNV